MKIHFSAYANGQYAADHGRQMDTCPYNRDTHPEAFDQWMDGYLSSKHEQTYYAYA